MKIIMLNGAPGSGKDTAANIIRDYIADTYTSYMPCTIKLASPLKRAVHALYALAVSEDYFESVKDTPQPILEGHTPRELYISIAENYAKPILGDNHFTKIFLRRCEAITQFNESATQKDVVFICSDLGFQKESDLITAHFGNDNTLLLRINRKGKSFKNDSRQHVYTDGKQIDIFNDYLISDLKTVLEHHTREFL